MPALIKSVGYVLVSLSFGVVLHAGKALDIGQRLTQLCLFMQDGRPDPWFLLALAISADSAAL